MQIKGKSRFSKVYFPPAEPVSIISLGSTGKNNELLAYTVSVQRGALFFFEQ